MKAILSFFIILLVTNISAQDYLGLEGEVPSNWSFTGSLSISSSYFKMGSESVQWDWSPSNHIIIHNPAGMAQACQTYKGGMILWIYNEEAMDADIKFEYRTSNASVQYYFYYHLNFTGWRACWIRFDEDMLGSKSNKDLTSLKITAPASSSGGRLFFDRMKFPSSRINDRVTPDAQLDFINSDMKANHWAALWHWHSTYQYEISLPAFVSNEDAAAFAEIRSRISQSITGSAPSSSRISEIRNEFADLQIQRNGDRITGAAFVPADEYVSANGDKSFKDVDDLVYDMAKAWYHTKESGFDDMFCDVMDWLYNQGLTVGSGLGTNHHYGYEFRGFPKAIWLMQGALKSAGKFQQAFEMIQYWTGVPEVRQLPQVDNFQGIVDAWNTIIPGRLMAIMLRDDSPELVRDMQSFTQWMNAVMQPSVGTMGGFKPDGAGFHHGMIYAGYMNGGYGGLGEVVNYTGNTSFNLSEEARSIFAKALEVHMAYANMRSLVNSVCGRNPMNQEVGTGAINALAYLAKATDPVDRDLAAEYMRLTKYKKELYDEFEAMGIRPAAPPVGNTSVNYGSLNLHRRDNWLVATKGFNNIVTGTEIYTSNNRYGRYQSYGAVQVLASGDPVSAAESGFVLDGWNWNRFPGTTSIHLPYEKLNYSGGNLNERSKNEEFAGACSLGDNGIWGMKLDENDYTNYTDDFVARKSVFAFNNRIICLGSGISNSNSQFNTETTLFQSYLANTSDVIYFNEEKISQFPSERSETITTPVTLLDTKGNGYYLPMGKLNIQKVNQESRNNKNRSVNYGDFASAWIDHGTSPVNAEYEYALLVQTSLSDLNTFKANMAAAETAPYQVVRKDNVAHIVTDKSSQTTGYVLFETSDDISDRHIKKTSYPCLVMVKELDGQPLQLAMSDPAINLETPTTLVHDAIAEERQIELVLNGRYSLSTSNVNCQIVGWEGNTTTLQFTCIHGLSINIELVDEVPLLSNLLVDGANPPNWSSQITNASLTIPEGHSPTITAEALNSTDDVLIAKPASYPGQVIVTVSNSKGTETVYTLMVNVAGEQVEDFENFLEDGWVNTSFVGNNSITWYIDAKRDSHLGTGTSIYSFNESKGVWSEPIDGGISSLSFDAIDKWAPDEERTIEVKINDQVVKTNKNTGSDKYVVNVENLSIAGPVSIAIQNISMTKAAVAIDNIAWVGYAQERNAFLSSITIDDVNLINFDKDVETYDVLVDSSEIMPVVSAMCESSLANYSVIYPESIPGNIVIEVMAEDGSWKQYVLMVDFSSNIGTGYKAPSSSIFPNPVKNQLFINSSELIDDIKVYALNGHCVFQQSGHVNEIIVSNLDSGFYFIDLTLLNGIKEVHKFIKR